MTGDWALRFLVITLCVTPLRKLLGQPALIRFRRMLGLFAFFYACLHFTTYAWLYAWLESEAVGTPFLKVVVTDIAKRPYITVGFFGLLCMLPLAITSTAGWIRRMGGKRWQLLHRLIYASAIAGVVHYYWLVKSDVRKPLMYGAMVGVLLLFRMGTALFRRAAYGKTTGFKFRLLLIESYGIRIVVAYQIHAGSRRNPVFDPQSPVTAVHEHAAESLVLKIVGVTHGGGEDAPAIIGFNPGDRHHVSWRCSAGASRRPCRRAPVP